MGFKSEKKPPMTSHKDIASESKESRKTNIKLPSKKKI